MKVALRGSSGQPSAAAEKGPSEHASQQARRGHLFYDIIAVLTIGVATTLALVLLQLITTSR
jgi:hypothetical protein